MISWQAPLVFTKMTGAGNDFILIDHRQPRIREADMARLARLLCRRKFSVGADGLILIEPSDTADFRWRFFNSDGSLAEMCGNGARCAARFAFLEGIAPAVMRFETLAGPIEARVDGIQVAVRVTPPKDVRLDRRIEVQDQTWSLHSLDTGVPHAVLFVDDIETVDVQGLGRQIRHHPMFQPAGTNVNFAGLLADGRLKVRTYERGVEAETLACGTGATAVALVAAATGQAEPPVDIVTSGGEVLTISFSGTQTSKTSMPDTVFLQGAAHLVYIGTLTPEALLGPD